MGLHVNIELRTAPHGDRGRNRSRRGQRGGEAHDRLLHGRIRRARLRVSRRREAREAPLGEVIVEGEGLTQPCAGHHRKADAVHEAQPPAARPSAAVGFTQTAVMFLGPVAASGTEPAGRRDHQPR